MPLPLVLPPPHALPADEDDEARDPPAGGGATGALPLEGPPGRPLDQSTRPLGCWATHVEEEEADGPAPGREDDAAPRAVLCWAAREGAAVPKAVLLGGATVARGCGREEGRVGREEEEEEEGPRERREEVGAGWEGIEEEEEEGRGRRCEMWEGVEGFCCHCCCIMLSSIALQICGGFVIKTKHADDTPSTSKGQDISLGRGGDGGEQMIDQGESMLRVWSANRRASGTEEALLHPKGREKRGEERVEGD